MLNKNSNHSDIKPLQRLQGAITVSLLHDFWPYKPLNPKPLELAAPGRGITSRGSVVT